MTIFENKTVVVTGGTGSLGKILIKEILSGRAGKPKKVIVFSRDEAKQNEMRMNYLNKKNATDEIIYGNYSNPLSFFIGDVSNPHSLLPVLKRADIVINAAALKQVPTCEYFTSEATKTNIIGAQNIVELIEENDLPVETVVGVSTDKACGPINVMGISKALQERIFISANIRIPKTRLICVRYGNVLASRGSALPLFQEQISRGGPVTITSPDMTRFILSLDDAVNIIFTAIEKGLPGEIYVPIIPSVRIKDVVQVMIGSKKIKIKYCGVRPGEKIHETLFSREEATRVIKKNGYFVIKPMLPELEKINNYPKKAAEYTKELISSENLLSLKEIKNLLKKNGFIF